MQVEGLQRDCFGGHAVWHPNDTSTQFTSQGNDTNLSPSIGTVPLSERCSLPFAHLFDWDT